MMNLIVIQIWRALPQSCITSAWSKLHLILWPKTYFDAFYRHPSTRHMKGYHCNILTLLLELCRTRKSFNSWVRHRVLVWCHLFSKLIFKPKKMTIMRQKPFLREHANNINQTVPLKVKIEGLDVWCISYLHVHVVQELAVCLMIIRVRVVLTKTVTKNSLSGDYSHPDDHTKQTTDTPGFEQFTTGTSATTDKY